jgi:hypothetical protein
MVAKVIGGGVGVLAELPGNVRDFMGSDSGRRIRHNLATIVIVGAPILSELPLVRKTPVGRLLRIGAVGVLVVKGAEWLRDWEPTNEGPSPSSVVRVDR